MKRVGQGCQWALCVSVAFLIGCAGLGSTTGAKAGDASDWAERDAAIMTVLDEYLSALNALDLEGHVATYHFPHYRHASGEIAVWNSVAEAMPILNIPEAERLVAVRASLEPDWVKSEWRRRDIIQGDDEKVHVATRFVRLREDGSVISTFNSLYVMTFEVGLEGGDEGTPRWAIRGRSSFAP